MATLKGFAMSWHEEERNNRGVSEMTLYELDAELRAVLSCVDENGELPDDAIRMAEELELSRADKADGYATLITEWQAVHAARKHEIDRLKAANETEQRNIDRLKRGLLESMTGWNEQRIDTHRFKVWRQVNPPSIDCADPSKLSPVYQRVKIEADKSSAMDVFKATGELPEGFAFKPTTESLRIK